MLAVVLSGWCVRMCVTSENRCPVRKLFPCSNLWVDLIGWPKFMLKDGDRE